MPTNPRKYDDEFKKWAVRLSYSSERPVTEVAKSLGITTNMICLWRKKYSPVGDKMKMAQQQEEVDIMEGIKHRWTFAEDKFCCQQYIEYYVVSKSNLDMSSFLRLLQPNLPDIQSSSLRMKIQNIKQIVLELGIKDTLAIKPLSNYSEQNKKAMTEVLRDKGI